MTRSRLPPRRDGAVRCAALAGALALAALVGVPEPASAAPQGDTTTPGDAARARELYRKGREEMLKDGHLPQAYALLHEAWELQRSFDTAGNLALVESKLTRYREAAEHASYALGHFPTGGSDAQRKALEEVLTAARTHVGTLTLRVNADHAAVTLDHQPLGESPFTIEIFVEPGRHTVEASLPGCEPVKDTVRADQGGAHLITLTFSKCGAGGGGGGGDQGHPPIVEQKGLGPVVIGGIAATAVGVGLGAVFAIVSKVKGDDASSAGSGLGPTACAGKSLPAGPCTTVHNALVAQDTFASAAVWTFVGAAAVGAGTLIYTFAVPRSPAAPKVSGVRVIPVAGLGTGGVVLKGAF